MDKSSLLLHGVPGSPYTRKMLAVLRYRRIAYRLYPSAMGIPGMPVAKPQLLPTFYLEGANGEVQAVTDSTPLIRRSRPPTRGEAWYRPTPRWPLSTPCSRTLQMNG